MPSLADEVVSASRAKTGDRVKYEDGGRTFEGVLMPRHSFSRPDVLILKLSSGYNVGLQCSASTRLTVVAPAPARAEPRRQIPATPNKPTVAVLGTGGTIASFVDYRTGAVHPAATAEELAFATPELFEVANIQAEVVYQVFSEDLEPHNWTELARKVKDAFDRGVQGVIIPHGTDTLHYTAAALSFALSDLPGPVVVVGAQRSSDRPSSDAASNLVAAARVAAHADVGEVVIVMHASSSDDEFHIIRGTRGRKNHTSRRDAFDSMNEPPMGRVIEDRVELIGDHRPRADGPVQLRERFETRVRMVWSSPLLSPQDLAFPDARGVVLAGTGLGHVPRRCLGAVQELTRRGLIVAMASQCLWGRVNLNVYSTGRDLMTRGVVSASDMTPETAFVKMMWCLGNAKDAQQAAEWFQTIIAGEIEARSPFVEA